MAEAKRNKITRQEFLERMPSPEVRQAAQRLMTVANNNGGLVALGYAGISIRRRCQHWENPVTVAWLYPRSGEKGWMKTKDFSFGAGIGEPDFFDRLPDQLRELLECWADSFSSDGYASDVSSVGVKAWSFTHEYAARHIDQMSDRLETVLNDLRRLGSA